MEIKFRQAIIEKGNFSRWHYWGLIDGVFVGIDTGTCSPTEAIKNSQRYTGLTDKNKARIYEGDIVERNGRKLEVYWHDFTACWRMTGHTGITKGDMSLMCEVIGNVYQDSHLLA